MEEGYLGGAQISEDPLLYQVQQRPTFPDALNPKSGSEYADDDGDGEDEYISDNTFRSPKSSGLKIKITKPVTTPRINSRHPAGLDTHSEMSEPSTRRTRSTASAVKTSDSYGRHPTRELRSRNRNRVPGSEDDSQSQQTAEQRFSRSGRLVASRYQNLSDDDDDDELQARRLGSAQSRNSRSQRYRRRGDDFIEADEDEDADVLSDGDYGARRSARRAPSTSVPRTRTSSRRPSRHARSRSKALKNDDGEEEFRLSLKDEGSDSDDDHVDDGLVTSPSPPPERPARSRRISILSPPRGYTLRPQKKDINYQIPPLLDDGQLVNLQSKVHNGQSGTKGKPRVGFTRANSQGLLGSFATLPAPPPLIDDSDSDDPNSQAKKASLASGGLVGSGGLASGTDMAAAAGGPANFGKISKDSGTFSYWLLSSNVMIKTGYLTALADTDPLGPNVSVTFDQVGGLDEHIASLKEMVTLPLLYPEIFQQFKITPPRGVLFHGPPGTGKTLLARALAASSRSGGRDIGWAVIAANGLEKPNGN